MAEAQELGKTLTQILQNNGVDVTGLTFYAEQGDGGRYGFYDPSGKNIFINLADQMPDSDSLNTGRELTHSVSWEVARAQTQTNDRGYAQYMGNYGESTGSLVNLLYGTSYSSTPMSYNSFYADNSLSVDMANLYVSTFNRDDVWDKSYKFSRKLDSAPLGTHVGIAIIDTYDNLIEKINIAGLNDKDIRGNAIVYVGADKKNDIGNMVMPMHIKDDWYAVFIGGTAENEKLFKWGNIQIEYNYPRDVAGTRDFFNNTNTSNRKLTLYEILSYLDDDIFDIKIMENAALLQRNIGTRAKNTQTTRWMAALPLTTSGFPMAGWTPCATACALIRSMQTSMDLYRIWGLGFG